jgi:uncharacterized lipoprotein YajG
MKCKLLNIAVCLGLLNGCAAQTFTLNEGNTATPTYQTAQHFFISGLGQEQTIDAAAVCGGVENVIKVEAQHTFINGLIGTVTFGIYTPRDAKVYCNTN